MSGGSKSSSTSAATTTSIDGRSVADAQGQAGYNTSNARDSGVVLSNVSGSAITLTDNGAVGKAFDFGGHLADLTSDAFTTLLDVTKANTATTEHINQTATEAIQKSSQIAVAAQDSNRFLVAGGLAVVALVAVKVWAK